jgi:very-short-patch-repair endonuclease
VNAQYYKALIQNISEHPEAVVNTFRDGKHFWKINQNTNMKLDAIVGNPPYQVMDGGNSASALPVYQYFVGIAKKVKPNYISMITPSRWFAGGRGLDDYRDEMINDKRLQKIVDFADSQECFPTVIISGGISYFLWEQIHNGDCLIVNKLRGTSNATERRLNESIFHGKLQKHISRYVLDIYLEVEGIDVEIDGAGHWLNVTAYKKMSREQFDENERIREKFLLDKGIKTIRFIAPNDNFPDDEMILDLFNQAKNLLNTYNTVRIYLEEDNRMEYY